MKKYVKKPIVVEAVQYNGNNVQEILNFCGGTAVVGTLNEITIKTLEGPLHVSDGDFIIKGVEGEFYPFKQDIFEKTYDVVEDGVRLQTFGEKAVGITFNPSSSDEVHEAKMLAAKQIDLLEKVHIKLTNDSANTSWVRNVLRTQAFNLMIQAQMALVKYITWKD